MPEILTLAGQMNESLRGKKIARGSLGNSPHKFVWYNRSHEEFAKLTSGRTVGEAKTRGKWLLLDLEPDYVLVLGECGGKVLYHGSDSEIPKKYHLLLLFQDNSSFSVTTQMWGAMELYESGKEYDGKYIKGMRTTPVESEFTFEYFSGLVDSCLQEKKRSVKGLLTQDQIIPGLGNAIAQDIMFRSGLHPKHPLEELDSEERRKLYDAILLTVQDAIEKGGRYDEYDLYNGKGGYVRIMDKNTLQRPCPKCGGRVNKIQYLGGACYICDNCQR